MSLDTLIITDVAPRDGLQNQQVPVSTSAKLRLIQLLHEAGVTSIEATSFVSPKAVPQMADAAELMGEINRHLPHLRASRGSLVAVTTAATRRFAVRDGLSVAPKAAIEALMRGIAAEEGRFGVRANCVGPGMLVDGNAQRLILGRSQLLLQYLYASGEIFTGCDFGSGIRFGGLGVQSLFVGHAFLLIKTAAGKDPRICPPIWGRNLSLQGGGAIVSQKTNTV